MTTVISAIFQYRGLNGLSEVKKDRVKNFLEKIPSFINAAPDIRLLDVKDGNLNSRKIVVLNFCRQVRIGEEELPPLFLDVKMSDDQELCKITPKNFYGPTRLPCDLIGTVEIICLTDKNGPFGIGPRLFYVCFNSNEILGGTWMSHDSQSNTYTMIHHPFYEKSFSSSKQSTNFGVIESSRKRNKTAKK